MSKILFNSQERGIPSFLSLLEKFLRKNPRIRVYSILTQKKLARLVVTVSSVVGFYPAYLLGRWTSIVSR